MLPAGSSTSSSCYSVQKYMSLVPISSWPLTFHPYSHSSTMTGISIFLSRAIPPASPLSAHDSPETHKCCFSIAQISTFTTVFCSFISTSFWKNRRLHAICWLLALIKIVIFWLPCRTASWRLTVVSVWCWGRVPSVSIGLMAMVNSVDW